MANNNDIVWYLMTFAMGVLLLGGGAWANSINQKVEKIASLEVKIGFIQEDISDIKNLVKHALSLKEQ